MSYQDRAKFQQKEQQQLADRINYYNEYCRLFLANNVLEVQLKQLVVERNELLSKLAKLEKKCQEASEMNSNQEEKKKRVRRSAADIARHYKCTVDSCSKSYGSEGSLNQHIKLKHPNTFKAMGLYLNNNDPNADISSSMP